ncbi:UPF0686 protein C11orf1 homolog [Arvicola amphibius]|uniref:UPF0686 protein C11orf1 homolog n=1 Tax=Arvicola amphibius TaxID=1047088 RepID=UPI001C0A0308|nr:UPF0686 protein C11orf1 homolog [Arvicola amphibius]
MEQLYKDYCFSLRYSDKSLFSPSSYSSVIQRQNLVCFLRNPHYGSLIYADGHGEVWTDWNSMSKFFQYGWRCSTNENSYSNRTLIGNWNQERYDLKNIVKPKPLPSQGAHGLERCNKHWNKPCHWLDQKGIIAFLHAANTDCCTDTEIEYDFKEEGFLSRSCYVRLLDY